MIGVIVFDPKRWFGGYGRVTNSDLQHDLYWWAADQPVAVKDTWAA
jgi:hypothetical protein